MEESWDSDGPPTPHGNSDTEMPAHSPGWGSNSKQGNKHRLTCPQSLAWDSDSGYLGAYHPHATPATQSQHACTVAQMQELTHGIAVATELRERTQRHVLRQQQHLLQMCTVWCVVWRWECNSNSKQRNGNCVLRTRRTWWWWGRSGRCSDSSSSCQSDPPFSPCHAFSSQPDSSAGGAPPGSLRRRYPITAIQEYSLIATSAKVRGLWRNKKGATNKGVTRR